MDFLRNIFRPLSRQVPQKVLRSLQGHFTRATGVEWTSHDNCYEAIFFHEEVETIAKFDAEGHLTEYRVNISPDNIPSPIGEAAGEGFEVMNCISVVTSDKLAYELIVRDKQLTRYRLVVDSLGNRVAMETL